jgi:membrane protein implicated in regulation of membrane protease activity
VKTRTRYFLLQIPGWVVVGALLAALHRWLGIPLWIAVAVWVIYVLKDFVLYPYLRLAYHTHSPSGAERLIGQVGVARQALEPGGPEGYVQIAGELWQARASGQSKAVPAGGRIRIAGAEGLVLIVSAEEPPARVQEEAEV